MPDTLVSSDLNLSRSPLAGPAFGCSSINDDSGAVWVRTVGELTHATAPQLALMLRQATRLARIVVVDLRGLTRVDSSGVRAIVHASHSARRADRRLILVRGLPRVDLVLALTGASHAIEIVDLADGEPLVLALLQVAHNDRAGNRDQAGVSRRFSEPVRSSAASTGWSLVASDTTSSTDTTATPNTVSLTHKENTWALERASL
jgi:anti-anti-sigma factor